MPTGPNLHVRVDEDRRLLIFSIKGEIESHSLTNDLIEALLAVPEPWAYSRIFDYRRSTGLFDFDEIARFMDWWQAHTHDIANLGKVAVLTKDVLFTIRAKTFDAVSPREDIQTFDNMNMALTWLMEPVKTTRAKA